MKYTIPCYSWQGYLLENGYVRSYFRPGSKQQLMQGNSLFSKHRAGATLIFYLFLVVASTLFLPTASHAQQINGPGDPVRRFDDLLPVVKKILLTGKNIPFDGRWKIDGDSNTAASVALAEGLQHHLSDSGATIALVIKPGTIHAESPVDTNRADILAQAYSISIKDGSVTIAANAAQGLYYGVQTFLQCLRPAEKNILLPEGEMTDWPDLSIRMIYWDDAHHLEKMDAWKRIIRQASEYKINAIAVKLEGHFQFSSAAPIVEPYALSPDEYQELTDYALAHFVQLVPYLDAPAHVSFILKHPEYARLRLYPDNNYEFSVADSGTASLVKNMFNELLNANRGGKYVVLSTDETYYTGKGAKEKQAAKDAGSNGKLLARFVGSVAGELQRQGRTVIFWGEFPLKPGDIPALPPYLVNGEYNEMASAFAQHGIRQFVYTSTQGAEPVFPNYYSIYKKDTLMEDGNDRSPGRVEGMLKDVRTAVDEKKTKLMGIIVAGWGDAGLHPETFWMGYTTGAAIGWNIDASNADDLMRRFYASFYGADTVRLKRIYQLLSRQANFFDLSWDWAHFGLRKPILGNSEGIFDKPEKARDQSIPMLPLPSPKNLSLSFDWISLNKKRMEGVDAFGKEAAELMNLLNQGKPPRQPYNWEVLRSVALLCSQNIDLLGDLRITDQCLKQAAKLAGTDPRKAIANIDLALSVVEGIKDLRDRVLQSVGDTWYKQWFPLVPGANGRKFLFEVDDIKDHQPGRTIDLSYLIYRQLNYPLGKWFGQLIKNRNQFAKAHHLPVISKSLDWSAYID